MNSDTHIRKKMIEELIKEVRGPRYGEREIISYDPWIEYLTGVIIPRSWVDKESFESPDEEIIMETDDFMSEDGSKSEDIIRGATSNGMTPKSSVKSFGVSFSMEVENPKLEICATWGRYFQDLEHDEAFDLKGETVKNSSEKEIWQRHSFGEIFEILIDDENVDDDTVVKESNGKELVIVKTLKNFESENHIGDEEDDGFVKIYIKRLKISENNYSISIYMINDLNYIQDRRDHRPDIEKCLFQPSIRINCDEKIKAHHMELLNDSEAELDFLYRKKPTVAFGHMCSAVWKKIDYEDKISISELWPDYSIRVSENDDYERFLSPDVRTEFIPLYPITLPQLDLKENDKLIADELNAETLANSSPDEIYNALIKLLEIYEDWIDENESEEVEDKYEEIADKLIDDEHFALIRMKRGLELVKGNELVYNAFCFANKTIALQNKWGNVNGSEFKWRPFQIGFFLMNLEDIFMENSVKRDVLDLLWIPTGGGKTEAYLGIMAFTIALRRLKAYQNNETGAGTSIISRYTLRLLTVQQFRRTLKMITAAEFLRIDRSSGEIGWRPEHSTLRGDWIYGSTRFSTGLWVGGGVSPIHLVKKDGAMDLLRGEDISTPFSPGEPAQILKCPICGSWLAVPESGLNDEENNLHIVIRTPDEEAFVRDILDEIYELDERIDFKDISNENHENGHYTLSFVIHGKFSRKQFDDEVISKLKDNGYEVASLGDYNLGYFTSLDSIEKFNGTVEGDYDLKSGAPIQIVN